VVKGRYKKAFWISIGVYTCLNALTTYYERFHGQAVAFWSKDHFLSVQQMASLLFFGAFAAVMCLMIGFLFGTIFGIALWPGDDEHLERVTLIGALSLNPIALIVYWLFW